MNIGTIRYQSNRLSNLSTISKLGLIVATPISLGLLRLLQKYLRWLFWNPLRRQGIPGPPCGFLFGQFFPIRREPFMQPHIRWIKQYATQPNYEDTPFIYYSVIAGHPNLLVLDKEVAKEIFTAPYGKHPLRFRKVVEFLRNILGDGLVTAEGETWMRHRQIIQPAFYTQVLKESLNATVPCLTREFVQYWKQSSMEEGREREIDVTSHLSSLTLDIIGRVAFSHEFHALRSVKAWAEKRKVVVSTTKDGGGDDHNSNNNEKGDDEGDDATLPVVDDPFIQALSHAFRFTLIGTISFILNMPAISRYFNPVVRRTRAALNAAVDDVIENAKKELAKYNENGNGNDITTEDGTSKQSLLQLLLQAAELDSTQKKALTHAELRDEASTFIFAGHETTATWCYMAIYALVTHPGIQEKVYQDIVKHAPKRSSEEKVKDGDSPPPPVIDLECVEKMEYFAAFLQEVLRLYPPVGMITRVNDRQDELGGYIIPRGTRFTLPIFLLHRHPKYWDNPETFDPERWLLSDENQKKEFDERIRFAFVPFAAGGRNCIGQRFATVEAKLILAELIRSFEMELAPSQKDTDFTFSNIVIMRTKPRLRIVVKARV